MFIGTCVLNICVSKNLDNVMGHCVLKTNDYTGSTYKASLVLSYRKQWATPQAQATWCLIYTVHTIIIHTII